MLVIAIFAGIVAYVYGELKFKVRRCRNERADNGNTEESIFDKKGFE